MSLPKNLLTSSICFALFFNEILSKTVETAQHVYMVSSYDNILSVSCQLPGGCSALIHGIPKSTHLLPECQKHIGRLLSFSLSITFQTQWGLGVIRFHAGVQLRRAAPNHEFVTCYHVILPGLA